MLVLLAGRGRVTPFYSLFPPVETLLVTGRVSFLSEHFVPQHGEQGDPGDEKRPG